MHARYNVLIAESRPRSRIIGSQATLI